jgi:polyisoprenoid-binding protein YceI
MKRVLPLAALLIATQAAAVEFNTIRAEQSRLGFGYKQMGVAMDGSFRKFSAQLAFDPAKPAAARVAIDVDLASIDTGSSEGDSEVAGKQWFDTKTHPTARFVSSTVKPLGGNRYEVTGQMSIKGRSRDVTTIASFAPQGNTAAFDGAFVLKRADFAIGEGPWADFDTVANEIQIRYRILATSGK